LTDDKAVASKLRKRNKIEREGQMTFDERSLPDRTADLAAVTRALDEVPDTAIAGVHVKASRFEELLKSATYREARMLADMWCAAFVFTKTGGAPAITTSTLRLAARDAGRVQADAASVAARFAADYKFFHWPIEFPRVFADGGGFDVVLGNPPWERVKLQEKEFFAARVPAVATARNAAERKRMIRALEHDDPRVWAAFREAARRSEGESHLLRNSGRYPLAGRGDINTYAVFAELMRSLLAPRGSAGVIVPSGIATDETTRLLFGDLVDRGQLSTLYAFDNRSGFFPAVGSIITFALLSIGGASRPATIAEFVFLARSTRELADPERRFTLTAEEFALLNPNTRTCPVFRSRRDAEIAKAVYRRVPVLMRAGDPVGDPWGVSFTKDVRHDQRRRALQGLTGPRAAPAV